MTASPAYDRLPNSMRRIGESRYVHLDDPFILTYRCGTALPEPRQHEGDQGFLRVVLLADLLTPAEVSLRQDDAAVGEIAQDELLIEVHRCSCAYSWPCLLPAYSGRSANALSLPSDGA